MNKEFSDNLKELRQNTGKTQKQIAEEIGVAKSTYSLYESGKREPNILIIKKIANALNVSASELLNIKVNENKELKLLFMKYKDYQYDKDSLIILDKLLELMKK